MVGVVPRMVGVVSSMAGVAPSTVGVEPDKPTHTALVVLPSPGSCGAHGSIPVCLVPYGRGIDHPVSPPSTPPRDAPFTREHSLRKARVSLALRDFPSGPSSTPSLSTLLRARVRVSVTELKPVEL